MRGLLPAMTARKPAFALPLVVARDDDGEQPSARKEGTLAARFFDSTLAANEEYQASPVVPGPTPIDPARLAG